MRDPSLVTVVRVDDYDPEKVARAVAFHLGALGTASLIRPGSRVLVKPNLVGARKVEAAATTHPAVVRAVCAWLKAHGAGEVVIADSPGGLYAVAPLDQVYAATGMKALSDVATLNYDTSFETRPSAPGCRIAAFTLIRPVCGADLIVNVAKLKTHAMTRLSAGIKNLFGCVPGLQKPELHYACPDVEAFSDMLVDLACTVAPAVTLIDAVTCMEGDGPTGGTPRDLGMILGSRNVFALDDRAALMMGMAPGDVAMLRRARERGLYDPDRIMLAGDEPVFAVPPFRLPKAATVDFTGRLPAFLRAPARRVLRGVLRPMPRLDRAKCVGCGRCAESCPAHIITIRDHKAIFAPEGCISCFCCQEMCPRKAITVRRALRRGRKER